MIVRQKEESQKACIKVFIESISIAGKSPMLIEEFFELIRIFKNLTKQ